MPKTQSSTITSSNEANLWNFPSTAVLKNTASFKLNNNDTEDFNIAQHKVNNYSEEFDKLINQPFVKKHISWLTYLTIARIIY